MKKSINPHRMVCRVCWLVFVLVAVVAPSCLMVRVPTVFAAGRAAVVIADGPWDNAACALTNTVTVTTLTPSYLLVGIVAHADQGPNQIVSVDGGGLVWTKLSGGTAPYDYDVAEFWGANSPGGLTAADIVVTTNFLSCSGVSILSLNNVDTASPVGTAVGPSETADNLSVTFGATTGGSMLFAAGFSQPWDGETVSAGADTVVYGNLNGVTQHLRSAAAVSGGSQTISSTGYTLNSNIEYAGVEILGSLPVHTLTYAAGPNGTLTGSAAQAVNDGAAGTAVTAVPDSGYHFVNWSDGSVQNPRTDTNIIADLSVTANFEITRGKSKGSPIIVYTPSVVVSTPVNGVSYQAAAVVDIDWTSADGAFTKYKIYFSPDDGLTWEVIAENITTNSFAWTIPDASTSKGKIKIEGYDSVGSLLASSVSGGNFSIVNNAPRPSLSAPPALVLKKYSPAEALNDSPDINADKQLKASNGVAFGCVSGSLIKGLLTAVYYCGADGRRYVFSTSRVYFSWYLDFSGVQTITEAQLAGISLGGNVTYRPGKLLVKAQTDPKVYAVAPGGILRWVTTEAKANDLYGANWNKMIDYIPDAFFSDYQIGEPL